METRKSHFNIRTRIQAFVCLFVFLLTTQAQEQQGIGLKTRMQDGTQKTRGVVIISGTAPKSYVASPYASGDYERKILVQNRLRKYLIHVPPSYDPDHPMPLILNFHGGGSNANQQRWSSGMDEKSDNAGFIAVYPEGSGEIEGLYTFNVGPGYGYAWENGVDDVLYVSLLLDDILKLFHVDRRRIYATGLSNGAMMCYRLASDLPYRIAAIAPIAGALPVEWLTFKRPVAILHIHGDEDEYFPFEGGRGKTVFKNQPPNDYEPVMDTIDWYIENNHCPHKPSQQYRKNEAYCRVFGPGDDGVEVVLWRIADGGHTWPSGRHRLRRLGKVSFDINANDIIWDFFKTHPMNPPDPSSP